MAKDSDFRIKGLGISRKGQAAAAVIVGFVRRKFGREASGGGCRAFYGPKEWRARGEEYGTESLLVVVHDGGDLHYVCSYLSEASSLRDELQEELKKVGVYMESCTGWYTAIYEI